ncbi:ASCH domain-containing protein [Aliarcobacter cryaerophilus]|jgi:predicted transcriptional regulator|uniref:ASCH domain-containing protein n=1 Tax=Aliarcobacter cryaerophilus TaxID=28198 RepID=UPI0021B59E0E|nr:ASCH domain-containing protein [Aliarcobacter cryaerophilus]MCT7535894.1 ASCH domain-containing protein [Aliarcobacter cryaerophilus]
MKVLLSIKPQFVEEIFNGNKKFEYRKNIFKRKGITSVVIYSTMPVGKIVGEFDIGDILIDTPKLLWEKTKNYSGTTEDFYDNYFMDRTKGYAIKIESLKKYKEPICPYKKFEKFTAPQSFKYLV